MKFAKGFFAPTFAGVLTTSFSVIAAIYCIVAHDLIGLLISLIFIALGAYILYECYQCYAPNGKYARVDRYGNITKVDRSSLAPYEMERTFGPNYTDYTPNNQSLPLPKNSYADISGYDVKTELSPLVWVPGTLAIGLGLALIYLGVTSDNSMEIIIGIVLIYAGVLLIVLSYYLFLKRSGKFESDNASASSSFGSSLLPGIVFFTIGAALIAAGPLTDRPAISALGIVPALFGLYALHSFIQCISPNGNMVSIKLDDGSYACIPKSMLTEKEIEDVTDSDGPEDRTLGGILSRTIDIPKIGFIIFAISVVSSLFVTISILMQGSLAIMAGVFFLIPAIIVLYIHFKAKKNGARSPRRTGIFRNHAANDPNYVPNGNVKIDFGIEYTNDSPQQKDVSHTENMNDNLGKDK